MKTSISVCPTCARQFEHRACINAKYCSYTCRAQAQSVMFRRAPPPCTVVGCRKPAHGRGLCNLHYKRMQVHGDPTTRLIREKGEGTPHIDGYWLLTIEGKSKLRHIHVAETALGKPLPAGAEVHHVDEDRSNDTPGNLVICPSRAYHQLLHRRMKALAMSGHADWRPCWICKRYDAPENLQSAGAARSHRACRIEYQNRGYHRRKNAEAQSA